MGRRCRAGGDGENASRSEGLDLILRRFDPSRGWAGTWAEPKVTVGGCKSSPRITFRPKEITSDSHGFSLFSFPGSTHKLFSRISQHPFPSV
jgi:hypothetical protein